MGIDLTDVQGVYKDAGSNIIFSTMELKREDHDSDLEMVQDLAEHLPAFENSLNIRYPDAGLAVAFGFSGLKNWRSLNLLLGRNTRHQLHPRIFSSMSGQRIRLFLLS